MRKTQRFRSLDAISYVGRSDGAARHCKRQPPIPHVSFVPGQSTAVERARRPARLEPMLNELNELHEHALRPGRNVRLDTLVRLRWVAVIGQMTAVLVVYVGLDFELPIWGCLAVLAL